MMMMMAACVSSTKPSAYLISSQVEITVVTQSLLQLATFWVARFLATDPASSWINKQLKWTFMFAGKCLTVVTAYSA